VIISDVPAAKARKERGHLSFLALFNRDDCKPFWQDAATTQINKFFTRLLIQFVFQVQISD
jgi:hypothetical protein